MKALRTAVTIVAAVVAVAAAIPTGGASVVGGATLLSAGLGVSVATASIIAAGVGLAAAAFSALTVKMPGASLSGNQTKFTASLDQGLPYVVGRTRVAGWIVHRQTFDKPGTKNNAFQTFISVWSAGGPIKAVEAFQIDGKTVAFDAPGNAIDGFSGFMWLHTQLGAKPEATALGVSAGGDGAFAGWTTASKLSGYAGASWTIKFDEKGKVFPGGAVPTPGAILKGALVYDPRLDSTYPGGVGACRPLDENTYVYSENGPLHGLTWALGRWQNAKRVLGIGMALAGIDVASYVQAANVADANGWKVGGTVYSTDSKWTVLEKMLASASAEPLQLGGMLSCVVDTPRVSLATITDDDIIGRCTVPNTARIRERINGVIPTYRSATHDWQLVPAKKVAIDAYVAEDGRPRTKAITWELVQSANQVAQLAAYHICNSREFGPAVLPLKLKWIGYRPGDAVTVASNTVGMENQLVVIRRRHLDPSTGAVTLSVRSETTDKHAFALGKTTTPPPTPSLQASDVVGQLLQPGIDASWSAVIDDDGNRPEDGADVTGNHTSKDTAAVDGVAAHVIRSTLADLTAPDGSLALALDGIRQGIEAEATARGLITTRLSAGATNLCKNGGFERGLDGLGGDLAGWTDSATTWGHVASAAVNGTGAIAWPAFSAQPNAWYVASADSALYASGGACYVDLIFLRGDGSVAKDGDQHPRAATHNFSADGSGRSALAVEVQAPADAETVIPRFVWANVTDCTYIAVREMMVELARLPASAYVANAEGARTGFAEIAGLQYVVSSPNGAFAQLSNTLTAQLAGATDSGLKTTITDDRKAAADATKAVGLRTDKVEARLRSRPNMQKNGGFERGLEGVADGGVGHVYDDVNWGRVYIHQHDGVTATSMPPVNVTPGTTYVVSADDALFAAAGTGRIDVAYHSAPDGAGSVSYGPSTDAIPAPFDYSSTSRRELQLTVPSGVQSLRVRYVTEGVASASLAGLRMVQVEQGMLPSTPYGAQGSLNDIAGSVVEQAGVLAQIGGKVQAFWQVRAVAGDRTATIGIIANDGDGSPYSAVLISGGDILLDGNVMVSGTLKARAFVTDEGVDYAALVPGSINWRTASAVSASYTGASVNSGVVGGTSSGKAGGGLIATFSASAAISWNSNSNGRAVNVQIEFFYALNGGAWTSTGIFATNNGASAAITTYPYGQKWSPPAAGTIAYAFRVTGNNTDGGAATVTVSNPEIAVENVNWK